MHLDEFSTWVTPLMWVSHAKNSQSWECTARATLSVLQCVAVCCSVLQCDTNVNESCHRLRIVDVHGSVDSDCVAVCCDCVAVCCDVSQYVSLTCIVLQCVAVCCSVLQMRMSHVTQISSWMCTAKRSVLQCVAMCCNCERCVAGVLQVCCSCEWVESRR